MLNENNILLFLVAYFYLSIIIMNTLQNYFNNVLLLASY